MARRITDIVAEGQALGVVGGVAASVPVSDDQTAAEVPFTPAGNIAATNVQAALAELDTEKAASGHTHSEPLITVEDVATTTYTVVAADHGKVKRFTAAGAVTVSLPASIAIGTLIELLFVGAAGGTVAASASTVNGAGTVAQHGAASCLVTTTDTWNVQGAA